MSTLQLYATQPLIAVPVTAVLGVTADVAAANVALVAPADTVTIAGTLPTPALLTLLQSSVTWVAPADYGFATQRDTSCRLSIVVRFV